MSWQWKNSRSDWSLPTAPSARKSGALEWKLSTAQVAELKRKKIRYCESASKYIIGLLQRWSQAWGELFSRGALHPFFLPDIPRCRLPLEHGRGMTFCFWFYYDILAWVRHVKKNLLKNSDTFKLFCQSQKSSIDFFVYASRLTRMRTHYPS